MAHVHGAAAKSATAHAGHGAGAAGASMAHHAHAGHATAMASHPGAAKAGMLAMGSAAATQQGKGLMGGLARHPLVVFSLGLAVGYLIHKYRKDIIQSATGLTATGAARERENLDDLVAECSDCDEGGASAGGK